MRQFLLPILFATSLFGAKYLAVLDLEQALIIAFADEDPRPRGHGDIGTGPGRRDGRGSLAWRDHPGHGPGDLFQPGPLVGLGDVSGLADCQWQHAHHADDQHHALQHKIALAAELQHLVVSQSWIAIKGSIFRIISHSRERLVIMKLCGQF